MKTIVVVPTYNERTNIQELVPRLTDELDAVGKEFGILVVDDDSPDGTGAVVEEMSVQDNRIMLLGREKKMGLGSAYVAGFKRALEENPDLIVQMDADFSHRPEVVPTLITETENAELVIGSRYINGVNITNWPLERLILSCCERSYRGFQMFPKAGSRKRSSR